MEYEIKQLLMENYVNQVAINEFAAIQAGADELIDRLAGFAAIPEKEALQKLMAGQRHIRPRVMGGKSDFERISRNRNAFNETLFCKLENTRSTCWRRAFTI